VRFPYFFIAVEKSEWDGMGWEIGPGLLSILSFSASYLPILLFSLKREAEALVAGVTPSSPTMPAAENAHEQCMAWPMHDTWNIILQPMKESEV
jgi:hypothetical protein